MASSVDFDITINKVANSRVHEQDFEKLPFGKIFSDHMLVADYSDGHWEHPQIVPYGKLDMSPALSALNYGQSIFEGMKAYYQPDGTIGLFRAIDNFHRLNESAKRMCMPAIPENIFMEGLKALIHIDKDWVPKKVNSSLYIRPVYFATDEAVGVKPSESYRLVIFTCPVGPYFTEPLRVYAETQYARSCEGGVGYAKAAGNYGGAFYPTKQAQEKGYHQIVWLDAFEHKYLEESGAMNLMVVIDGKLITPVLSGSKLAGITRDSVLKVARKFNIPCEERNISITELIDAHQKGLLQEMFGCGTAAQIAPIALFGYNNKDYELPSRAENAISGRIGNFLNDLKYGKIANENEWMTTID